MLPKKTKPPGDEDNPDAWMLTYSDMITLMLTFFVILIAISTVDPLRVELLTKSMNKAMDKTKVTQVSIEKLVEDVNNMIVLEQLQDAVDVSITPRGVAVSAKGAVLFPSGSTQLLSTGYKILDNMANIILETPYNISVEGHTDSVPISGTLASHFPSNWELSSARASAIVRRLVEKGIPKERLRAAGLADTEPIAPNNTEEGRSKNRRVTIVFLVF